MDSVALAMRVATSSSVLLPVMVYRLTRPPRITPYDRKIKHCEHIRTYVHTHLVVCPCGLVVVDARGGQTVVDQSLCVNHT